MLICSSLNVLPHQVKNEDKWTIDFLNIFFTAKKNREKMEKDKMEFLNG